MGRNGPNSARFVPPGALVQTVYPDRERQTVSPNLPLGAPPTRRCTWSQMVPDKFMTLVSHASVSSEWPNKAPVCMCRLILLLLN